MVAKLLRLTFPLALLVMLGVSAAPVLGQAAGPAAIMVYGQADFTTGAPGAGPNGLNYPLGIMVDHDGGFYLSDRNNHRVLYFANDGDTNPDRVYGQHGDFNAHIVNNDGAGNSGAPSPDNLASPTVPALDGQGGLYITDRDNHRVLHFPPGVTTADRVYGQFGNFNTNMTNNDSTANYGEPSADNIGTYTLGVVVDSTGGFYVSDTSNHRVLYFANDGNTTADRVYGQSGDFTTNARNNDGTGRRGAPNANSLNFPRGLALDASDGLYVADRDNSRVLYFANDGDTNPDRVYGQFGSYTTNAPNNDGNGNSGAPSANSLDHPKAMVVGSSGGLYVADSFNHRVLYFANDGDTTADRVFGQFGSFTTNAANNDGSGNSGAPSAQNLSLPQGLSLSPDGSKLYVADTGNNRVLVIPLNIG